MSRSGVLAGGIRIKTGTGTGTGTGNVTGDRGGPESAGSGQSLPVTCGSSPIHSPLSSSESRKSAVSAREIVSPIPIER